jgi:hypothetical protein
MKKEGGLLWNLRGLPAIEKREKRDTSTFKSSSLCKHRGLYHDLISRNISDELTFNTITEM